MAPPKAIAVRARNRAISHESQGASVCVGGRTLRLGGLSAPKGCARSRLPYNGDVNVARYRPLGWLTGAACFSIAATVVGHIASDAASFVNVGATEDDLGSALVGLGGAGVLLAASLFAAIVFLVWFHRAAGNVRAFGAVGLRYTPGWCVGWWLIPLASLWKPYGAMQEVWRASEPDAVGQPHGWTYARTPKVLQPWWATYVVGNVLGNLSGRIDDPTTSAMVGVACTAVTAVCAVLAVVLVRDLGRRQDECGRRLAEGPPAPPPAAWSAYPPGYGPAAALENPYAPPR